MILDFNKKEIKEGDEVMLSSKKGQSIHKVVKKNKKFFAFNDIAEIELTDDLIKNFKIQKWK